MPSRILFLDQFSSLGGGQRVLSVILKSLPPDREPIVALNGHGEFARLLEDEGIQVKQLPIGEYSSRRKPTRERIRFLLRTLGCIVPLALLVFRRKVGLIYANGPRTFLCAVAIGVVTRRPVVWHLHNVLRPGAELNLTLFLSRWVCRIVTCSHAVAEPLLSQSKPLASKVHVVYNPPMLKRPNLRAERDKGLIGFRQPILASSLISFGIIGRVTPFKGQLEFVRAARRVLETHPAIFWIIGSPAVGDPEDEAYLQEIRSEIARQKLDEAIVLLPEQTNIEACYALIDVVVLASQEPEGFGLTALEAMMMGKAIIAPATGGIPEILDDETALLVPDARWESLVPRMLELLHDAEKRRRLGGTAQAKARLRFSHRLFQEGVQELIASIPG